MATGKAVQVTVAEGILALLSAGTFCLPFEPQRSYAEDDKPLELGEPGPVEVFIVAVTTEQVADPSSRGKLRFDVPIDIAVLRKFGVGQQSQDTGRVPIDEIDQLVLLVEQLHEALTMVEIPCATWQSTKITANPIKQHLREMRQFTGIVRVTFRADKNLSAA